MYVMEPCIECKSKDRVPGRRYCGSCYYQKKKPRHNELSRNHYHRNKERYREQWKMKNAAAKKLVIERYGGRCGCCAESNPVFLSIDHINGGGTKDRKQNHTRNMWIQIANNKVDFETYQLLCFNCNWGKYINGGKCPHQEI